MEGVVHDDGEGAEDEGDHYSREHEAPEDLIGRTLSCALCIFCTCLLLLLFFFLLHQLVLLIRGFHSQEQQAKEHHDAGHCNDVFELA